MRFCNYGKPARSGAAVAEAPFRLTEAVHGTVDSATGLRLTKAVETAVSSLSRSALS